MGVGQKIFQVLHKLLALEPASDMALDVKSILCPLLEVELEEVARFVTSEQTLNQD